MKIYTITCNNAYNYGAVLQEYALWHYLERLGNDCEVIDFKPDHLRKISKKYRKNLPAILFRRLVYLPDYARSERVFQSFRRRNIRETMLCRSADDIARLSQADLYICGSDQIWNPMMENGYCKEYYFDIGLDIRKVAYAASIGIGTIDEAFASYLQRKLTRFEFVTVRERQSVALLHGIGIQAECVLDPVFLLSAQEWASVSSRPLNEDGYVLVYALHHVQCIYDYASRLAVSLGLKVFVVSVELKEYGRSSGKFFWNPAVEDFLSLVSHASAVVTNSFHGVALSCIFRRPLHIFDTEAGDIRIASIVETLALNHRLAGNGEKLLDNIFEPVTETIMADEVERSRSILHKMVSGETL